MLGWDPNRTRIFYEYPLGSHPSLNDKILRIRNIEMPKIHSKMSEISCQRMSAVISVLITISIFHYPQMKAIIEKLFYFYQIYL